MPPFLLSIVPYVVRLSSNPVARKVALGVALAVALFTTYKVHVHSVAAQAAQAASIKTELALRDSTIARDVVASTAAVARADSLQRVVAVTTRKYAVVSAKLSEALASYDARPTVNPADTVEVKAALAMDSVVIGQCRLVVRTCEEVQADQRATISALRAVVQTDSVATVDLRAAYAAAKRATSVVPAEPAHRSLWEKAPWYVKFVGAAALGAVAEHQVRH